MFTCMYVKIAKPSSYCVVHTSVFVGVLLTGQRKAVSGEIVLQKHERCTLLMSKGGLG